MGKKPIKEKLDQRIHDHELEPLPNRAHEITPGVMRQNEERHRDILESIEEGYFELDLKGTFTFVNNAACALLGYEYDELIGINYKTYTSPETARHMYEVFRRIFETGKPEIMVDYEVFRKDGSVRIHEMNASLLRDTLGQPMGFRVLVWDLTESKREDDVIRKREERYRNILESMEEAYFEVDLKGNLTFFNFTAVKRLGYSNEEVMGMNFRQFVDDENARKVFNTHHQVFLTGKTITAFEWEFINKQGEKIAVEASVGLRRDENGSPIGFRGVVRDISERKKAEAAQCESEEKYRSILENIEEGYFEVDPEGNFTFFNDSICRMIGYSREEMMGMNYGQFMEDKYKLKVYNTFHNVFLTGQSDKGIDLEIVGKDGSRRHIESSVALIRNSNGEPVGFRGIIHDITERKRAEEALRQSEGRLKTILETIQAGIVMIEPETHQIADVNSIAVNMIGKTREEIIGSVCHKFICPAEKGECPITDLGQEVDRSERVLLVSGGKRCPIIKTVRSIILDGKTYLFESFIDISERKQAEEELKKSEERYRTIFENTGNASVLLGEDTIILLANSNFENLTGYSKQEVEGKMSWTAFVSPEDLEKITEYHVKRRIEPDSFPEAYEFSAIKRNGETIDVFMNIALIPDTKVSIASIMDITDRKRFEKALQESEERFRDLANLLPETVFETDKEGRFTFLNQSSLERFGYSQDEITRGVNFIDVIAPEDHERVILNYFNYIKGENIGLNEYTARKRNGSTFPVLAHSTVVYHDGELAGIRGFLIDITEKKNIEQQLVRAQKMEAIGTLAGGIAHDFNNLLMGILGNVSLMLMNFGESHPLFSRLKTMEEYVLHGSDLTKQLLGFAKGGKYEIKPTHLGEFVRKSSELFGRTKKEICIHLKDQKGLWTVEADRGQMEQVLLNLYINAWQAMPSGGDLYISTENVELGEMDVSPYDIKPGKFVKITVTDTGIGIDEATQAHIFEPFFTTRERERGTGLGLASAYGIIKNHGGFINVESEKDLGSSFIIYLPASGKTEVEDDFTSEDEIQKGQENILLIDDEKMILDIGSAMLERLGYRVITAIGGRLGLQIYEKDRNLIDLVILDMIMPDFGGKETFDTLRRINPSVRVLLSSGYSLDGQAREIIQSGCKGFIQKPYTIVELSKKIRGIFDA